MYFVMIEKKKKKCLCYARSFENADSLKDHYVLEHNVNRENYFFQKLFTRDRIFPPRKCFRYEYFCINGRDEKIHNFITHYQQGGRLLIEDKTLTGTYFDENLQKYCI